MLVFTACLVYPTDFPLLSSIRVYFILFKDPLKRHSRYMTFDAIAGYNRLMILLCPPEKSKQFHYPLDPKKIRAEGSMHKDATYQGRLTGKTFTDKEEKKKNNTKQMPPTFRLGLP